MNLLSLGWLLLVIIYVFIGVWFFYLYFKGRDKRKLMFAITFLSSSISYLLLAMGYSSTESNLLLQNLYHWAAMPLMVTIFIAVTECIYKVENFDRIFKIFLVFFVSFFLVITIPFSIGSVLSIVRQVLAVAVIAISVYAFLKGKGQSSLMFLLSLICFTVAGMAQARNMVEFSIFSYFIAYIFLALVFTAASTSVKKDKHSIDSYFSLEKKLETTEEALRKSEERYRTIVENTSDAIMLTQPDGIISYMSQASEKVLGYRPEELVGKQPWIIHPDDLKKVQEVQHQALTECTDSNLEYRIITKQGETKWVSHQQFPL